jgi:hypothetical protein
MKKQFVRHTETKEEKLAAG